MREIPQKSGSWFFEALARFPVTILTALPYVVLIVPTALRYHNPDIGFIVRVLSWALLGSFLVELVANLARAGVKTNGRRWREKRRFHRSRYYYRLGVASSIIGSAAGVVAASTGAGTVFTQVLGGSSSPIAAVASMAGSWTFAGFGLCLAAFRQGSASRREILVLAALLMGLMIAETSITAITSPAIALAIFLSLSLFLFRVLSLRALILVPGSILAVWPWVFEARNEARREGGVYVSQTVDAFDRLRFDLQISRAATLPVPNDIGQPDLLQSLRYSFIPRIFDRSRPPLSTGSDINVFLGGSSDSSYSFLPVTTLYFLEGPIIVAVFYGIMAILVCLLSPMTRPGAMRVSIFCLLLGGPLAWFASVPGAAIGFVQGCVAFVGLLLIAEVVHIFVRSLLQPRYSKNTHGSGYHTQ